MSPSDKKLIRKAIKNLRLLDIVLYESRFSRPNDILDDSREDFNHMTKTVVEFSREDTQTLDVLVIKICFGVRLTEPKNDDVYVEIEADFLALYEILSPLDKKHMRAFSKFNGVHNVWPFWRQYVFDMVQRGDLPEIDIPLYS